MIREKVGLGGLCRTDLGRPHFLIVLRNLNDITCVPTCHKRVGNCQIELFYYF
jgi:hypothetical protein